MSFYEEINRHSWETTKKAIYSKNSADVESALSRDKLGLDDFMALVSPAAGPYLEKMARKSMQKTQKRFGKTMQLYIPVYLSNSCTNTCVYCGFNHKNKFERMILSKEEMLEEFRLIKKQGFEHVLLVTGEDNKNCGIEYLIEMVKEAKKHFSLVSLEVQPLLAEEYKTLSTYGLNTVYIYQETYNQQNYKTYHPGGKKSDFRFRLETPDRLGQARIHKIGLGCLLGLEDWRVDTFFTAMHLNYLEKKYWQSRYSVSFPRLRPHMGNFKARHLLNERDLAQIMCAYRLFNEHVELSLTTRESKKFRDHMLKLGATSYSAGSKTNPGGYSNEKESTEQFAVHDNRDTDEIASMIRNQGYEVVWKDWDSFMQQ